MGWLLLGWFGCGLLGSLLRGWLLRGFLCGFFFDLILCLVLAASFVDYLLDACDGRSRKIPFTFNLIHSPVMNILNGLFGYVDVFYNYPIFYHR